MFSLLKSLYHLRSCRNSSEYSKTSGNFLPLLMMRLVRKFVWEIFNIISSDVCFRIFYLDFWCCCIRGILILMANNRNLPTNVQGFSSFCNQNKPFLPFWSAFRVLYLMIYCLKLKKGGQSWKVPLVLITRCINKKFLTNRKSSRGWAKTKWQIPWVTDLVKSKFIILPHYRVSKWWFFRSLVL